LLSFVLLLNAGLKQLGFDYVFDTDFAADLTIMEEGTELLHRLKLAWGLEKGEGEARNTQGRGLEHVLVGQEGA
jgi:hypothetical protein